MAARYLGSPSVCLEGLSSAAISEGQGIQGGSWEPQEWVGLRPPSEEILPTGTFVRE